MPGRTSLSLVIASLLAFGIASPAARAEKPPQTAPAAVSASAKYEKEIEAFEALDKKAPPPTGAVLFVGDSAIRMWKTVAYDFADQKVINRGFGGSEMADSTYFADRIVIPYKPRVIVFKAGGNDITAGRTAEQLLADFKAFVEKVHAALPETRIAFLSLSPNPARWGQAEERKKANALIKAYIDSGKNLDFILLWDEFLGPDGKPREDLFLKDRLHNNPDGYKIVADVVRPHLK